MRELKRLKNREDVAVRLKEIVPFGRFDPKNTVFVGISPGGLKIAEILNEELSAKIDILFSESIYTPNNKECEIAKIGEDEEILINDKLAKFLEIEYDYIYNEAHRKYEEDILSKLHQLRQGEPFIDVYNKIVILVDDGVESGLSVLSAIKTIFAKKPKALYIAVGVLPKDVLDDLKSYADEVFYIYAIDDFVEISLYYEELGVVGDEEIEKIIRKK